VDNSAFVRICIGDNSVDKLLTTVEKLGITTYSQVIHWFIHIVIHL